MLIRGAAFLVPYNLPYLLPLSLLMMAGSLVACCQVGCCCIAVFTLCVPLRAGVALGAWLHGAGRCTTVCYCCCVQNSSWRVMHSFVWYMLFICTNSPALFVVFYATLLELHGLCCFGDSSALFCLAAGA